MADAPKPATAAPMLKVEILRDYWPKDQRVANPDPLTTNERRLKAGEIHELPQEEALDLIEAGAAKQYRVR